jgi:hypothetical protein
MAAAYGFTMHRLSYYKDHLRVQEVIAVLTMDWGEQQAKAEIKRRKRMQPPSTGWWLTDRSRSAGPRRRGSST